MVVEKFKVVCCNPEQSSTFNFEALDLPFIWVGTKLRVVCVEAVMRRADMSEERCHQIINERQWSKRGAKEKTTIWDRFNIGKTTYILSSLDFDLLREYFQLICCKAL